MSQYSKRRRSFVDPTVQGALAMRIGFYCACFLSSVFLILAGAPLLISFVVGSPDSHSIVEILWAASRKAWPIGVATGLMLPFLIRDLVNLSHRFAGPVFRIRSAMKTMVEGGDPGEIKLREGDHWQELAVYLNQINDRIRSAESLSNPEVGESVEAPANPSASGAELTSV